MNVYTLIESTEFIYDSELFDAIELIGMEDDELEQQIERSAKSESNHLL